MNVGPRFATISLVAVDRHIFREYDIRGRVGTQLDADSVREIARGIGVFFAQNGAKRIVIGRDARLSSPEFHDILADGLTARGCDVVSVGMVPTPVLYHALFIREFDGAVMVTGSHNPPDHNGFKISLGTASLFGDQIREIGEIVALRPLAPSLSRGTMATLHVLDDYRNDIASRIELGPRKIKAVIDAGNGMGSVTAVPLYRHLAVEVIELFSEPDGTFPNHEADPTVEENLHDLIAAVAEHKADVGIAFDGDGDRIGVVDETGRIIWGDELMIPFARSILAERPGSTIIGEVKCSQTLFDEIQEHGGHPLMWKAGHSLIKAKMKETGAVFAGEMSGHFFFADRYYGFDDACYAGARLIELLSRSDEPLSGLFADILKTFKTPELRVPCPDPIKFDVVRAVARQFTGHGFTVDETDGARISFDSGWGLVRPSNTQEILVLRFEANTAYDLETIREAVESIVKREISLR